MLLLHQQPGLNIDLGGERLHRQTHILVRVPRVVHIAGTELVVLGAVVERLQLGPAIHPGRFLVDLLEQVRKIVRVEHRGQEPAQLVPTILQRRQIVERLQETRLDVPGVHHAEDVVA